MRYLGRSPELSEHPTVAELEGLITGRLSSEQARFVVRHLLRGCESCRAAVAPYISMLVGRERDVEDRPGSGEAAAPGSRGEAEATASSRGESETASSRGEPETASSQLPSYPDSAYENAIERAFAAFRLHSQGPAPGAAPPPSAPPAAPPGAEEPKPHSVAPRRKEPKPRRKPKPKTST